MNWLDPHALWALAALLPAAGLFAYAAWRRRQATFALGALPQVRRLARAASPRRRRWKAALYLTALALVVVALAGPRYGTRLREVEREGIDLVVALDVSMSMLAEDVAPSRLERAKNEIKKLLGDLDGDRVALVVFAGDAFIQAPLTSDYGAVRLFLDVAEPSAIPTPGTDFGRAMTTALRAFEVADEARDQDRTRAILFVSDGENHVADVEALVEEAADAGVVVYAAGVGETDGVLIPLYQRGRRIGFKKDRQGDMVTTRLEEAGLQALAERGAYFRIARTSSSLSQLPAALDRLDKTSLGEDVFEAYREQYQWPLAVALVLLVVELLVPARRRARDEAPDYTRA